MTTEEPVEPVEPKFAHNRRLLKYNQDCIGLTTGLSHYLDTAQGLNHERNLELINFIKQANLYNFI